jgi:hypothetical protein
LASSPLPSVTSLLPPDDPPNYGQGRQDEFYNAFYKLFRMENVFGNTVEIDPVVLWPILDDNPSCNTPTPTATP